MTVQHDLFEDNWDRIFNKKTHGNGTLDWSKAHDYGSAELREVNYDGFWSHSCTVGMEVVFIAKDETCDYCGAWEEDEQ